MKLIAIFLIGLIVFSGCLTPEDYEAGTMSRVKICKSEGLGYLSQTIVEDNPKFDYCISEQGELYRILCDCAKGCWVEGKQENTQVEQ